jgi:ParB family chromosome partitioning protein
MSKKIATPKGSAAVKQTSVVRVPLSNVREEVGFNVRSGDFTEASGTDEHGFEEIYLSIRDRGQDTAVDARPDPKKPGHYILITGHRRHRALARIQDETKTAQTILVSVRDIGESKADIFALNLRENVSREDVTPSDVSFGLKRLKDARKEEGTYTKDGDIYSENGITQGYGSKLLTIAEKLHPELFKHWRESNDPLPVAKVVDIAKLDKEKQREAYEKEIGPDDPESRAPSKQSEFKKQLSRVKKAAELLGSLAGAELLDCSELDFTSEDTIAVLLDYPEKKPTKAQYKQLGVAASEAYAEAVQAFEEEEDVSKKN